MDEVEITIVNWQKHQEYGAATRSDRPHQALRWLKLNNMVYRSVSLYQLNDAEKWAFICLLCLYGQKGGKKTRIPLDWWEFETRVQRKILLSCLDKLNGNTVVYQPVYHEVPPDKIRVDKSRSEESIKDYCPKENQCTVLESSPSAPVVVERVPKLSDFEALYEAFPRKVGRKKGLTALMRKYQASKNKAVFFEAVKAAIEKYKEHLIKEETEPRFVQHFSTFVNSWEDWLHPEAGQSTGVVKPANKDWKELLDEQEKANGQGKL